MKILLFVLLVLSCAGCRHEAKGVASEFDSEDVPYVIQSNGWNTDTKDGCDFDIKNGDVMLNREDVSISVYDAWNTDSDDSQILVADPSSITFTALKQWVTIHTDTEEIIIKCDEYYQDTMFHGKYSRCLKAGKITRKKIPIRPMGYSITPAEDKVYYGNRTR